MATVRIQAKVSPAVHDGLKRTAKDEGRTLSSMIAYVLRMYVDRAEVDKMTWLKVLHSGRAVRINHSQNGDHGAFYVEIGDEALTPEESVELEGIVKALTPDGARFVDGPETANEDVARKWIREHLMGGAMN